MSLREKLKRFAPHFARDALIRARLKLAQPLLEEVVLHDYLFVPDIKSRARVSFVIPSIASRIIFGGVVTGLEFFFAFAKALGAQPRIVIEQFNDKTDHLYIQRAANRAGFGHGDIEILRRTADRQPIDVRKDDVFLAYNWWIALNLRGLLSQQQAHFRSAQRRPLIYIVQDYEPAFYHMSSTHMLARAVFDGAGRTYGVFNSHELHAYFRNQGHKFEHEFVFAPRMPEGLRAALCEAHPPKTRSIIVYGRPILRAIVSPPSLPA